MKVVRALSVICWFLTLQLFGQISGPVSPGPGGATNGLPVDPPTRTNVTITITERGPDQLILRRVQGFTNHLGLVRFRTNSIIQLESGMHYQTNGQWLPSREQIAITANGARAVAGRHKVNFAPNVNAATGAVQLVTSDNKLLRTRILGLAYHDFLTGTNVLIAELQDAQGLLARTNQLVYTNAFSDFRTDVRYTYTKAGLEQDVIMTTAALFLEQRITTT